MPIPRSSVLFVCTHNSARSQMAEGWLRALHGDRYTVYSAGTEATRVHPLAVRAMQEAGVNLADHTSKTVDMLLDERGEMPFDYVVTVCDDAREACPYVPARCRNLHHAFPDPSAAAGSEAEQLDAFRTARDAIRAWLAPDPFGASDEQRTASSSTG